jgi:hypothetical protein
MKIRYFPALILLLSATFIYCAKAQDKVADTSPVARVSANMGDYFNKAIGQQSRIFTGPLFEPYKFISKTNPNFQDTTAFINGSVNYEGVVYNDVPLIYDMYRDMLVSRNYNGFSVFYFLSYRVSNFDLSGHHFIRFVPDNLNKNIDEGYYEELYNNKLQILARRGKAILEEKDATPVKYTFYNNFNYFLKLHGTYYNINSQGKLLDALKDKKKELKQYLKTKNIRYQDNPEQNMVLLASYYAQLTN